MSTVQSILMSFSLFSGLLLVNGLSTSTKAKSAPLTADLSTKNGATFSSLSTSKGLTLDNSTSRSLLQNWWPVVLEESLHRDKPNPITLLGQKLVLLHDDSKWKCLEDKCSHRFVPLSEGRIVRSSSNTKDACSSSCTTTIQCSYHGWEFDGEGQLIDVPQQHQSEKNQRKSTGKGSIPAYPTQVMGGMVWVWSDPTSSTTLARQKTIPVSPLLEEYVKDYPGSGFMRDLPYGFELLGENLVDVSHLPFSHHGTGGFDRDLARPLDIELMGSEARHEYARHEYRTFDEATMTADGDAVGDILVPTFQARVKNASLTDPTLVMFTKAGRNIPENSTSSTAFFAPSHIRYRRNRGHKAGANIELFLCPTEPGRSRVFLFTAIERLLKRNLKASADQKKTVFSRWKQRIMNRYIKRVLSPNAAGHLVANDIFDGDGIFLRLQGEYMSRYNLTDKDYYTPASADVSIRAFRRWVKQTADAEHKMGGALNHAAAYTISGGGPCYNAFDFGKRSDMLNRYEQHTKYCKICQEHVSRLQRRKSLLKQVRTLLLGSLGASLSLMAAGGFASGVSAASPRRVGAMAASFFVVFLYHLSGRNLKRAEQEIQKFYYSEPERH